MMNKTEKWGLEYLGQYCNEGGQFLIISSSFIHMVIDLFKRHISNNVNVIHSDLRRNAFCNEVFS